MMFLTRVYMLHQQTTAGSFIVQSKQAPVHVPESKKLFTVPFVPLLPLIGLVVTEHVVLGVKLQALLVYSA